MIKAVYNESGYGLFLSEKALNFLAEKGVTVSFFGDLPSGKKIERHNPYLVECVEKLGNDACKFDAKLKVATVSNSEYIAAKYFIYQLSTPGEKVVTPDNLCLDWVVVDSKVKENIEQPGFVFDLENPEVRDQLLSIKSDIDNIKSIIAEYKQNSNYSL